MIKALMKTRFSEQMLTMEEPLEYLAMMKIHEEIFKIKFVKLLYNKLKDDNIVDNIGYSDDALVVRGKGYFDIVGIHSLSINIDGDNVHIVGKDITSKQRFYTILRCKNDKIELVESYPTKDTFGFKPTDVNACRIILHAIDHIKSKLEQSFDDVMFDDAIKPIEDGFTIYHNKTNKENK